MCYKNKSRIFLNCNKTKSVHFVLYTQNKYIWILGGYFADEYKSNDNIRQFVLLYKYEIIINILSKYSHIHNVTIETVCLST